jgi:hypothetical protein
MHERVESYGPVVPAQQPNNAARAEAVAVEERGPAKENAASKTRPGHRAGTGVSSALGRVRQVARGVHLFVHYDGKGDRGEQADSWLDRAYFAEPALLRWAGDTQPLDWQLQPI